MVAKLNSINILNPNGYSPNEGENGDFGRTFVRSAFGRSTA